MTAPSMTSSDSSLASDSTISTPSVVPATTRSSLLVSICVERRVEHVLAVDIADAGPADRAHERHAGDGQRRRGADHRHDVGIVLHVVASAVHDDLRLVAVAVGEQRPDRPVDQARGQHFLLGRPALALEEAARDLAGGEGLLLVVDGQREEIEPGLRLLLERPRWPAPWCRRRSPARRRRPGGRSCRSPGPACGRAQSISLRNTLNISVISIFLSYRPCAPVWRRRPPAPLRRQDRDRPLHSPLPSRYLRSRVGRPIQTGTGRRDAKRPRHWGGAGDSATQTQTLDQRRRSACCPWP